MFTVYFLFLFVNIWEHFFSTPDLSFGSVCVLRLSSRKTSPKKTQKNPHCNPKHGTASSRFRVKPRSSYYLYHKENIMVEFPYLVFQWRHSLTSFPQTGFSSLEFDLVGDATSENRKQMCARFKHLLLSFPSNWIIGGGRTPAASGYPPAAVTLIRIQAAHGSRGDNVITMCQRLLAGDWSIGRTFLSWTLTCRVQALFARMTWQDLFWQTLCRTWL